MMRSKEIITSVILASSLSACVLTETENQSAGEIIELPAETIPETLGTLAVESTTTTTMSVETTTILPSTTQPPETTIIQSSTTTTVATEELVDNIENHEIQISREALVDGVKVADILLTNPGGEQLVAMPLFAVTDIFNTRLFETQLERGAMLFVAHPDVNPDKFGVLLGIPQMGLPGEGGVTSIFGHNVSSINPDFDGDPSNGNEGEKQRVFYRLDEVRAGARLEFMFTEIAGGGSLSYILSETRVVEDVQPGGEGTGMTFDKAQELYAPQGSQEVEAVQLIKCTPDGSVRDRFVAVFIPT